MRRGDERWNSPSVFRAWLLTPQTRMRPSAWRSDAAGRKEVHFFLFCSVFNNLINHSAFSDHFTSHSCSFPLTNIWCSRSLYLQAKTTYLELWSTNPQIKANTQEDFCNLSLKGRKIHSANGKKESRETAKAKWIRIPFTFLCKYMCSWNR